MQRFFGKNKKFINNKIDNWLYLDYTKISNFICGHSFSVIIVGAIMVAFSFFNSNIHKPTGVNVTEQRQGSVGMNKEVDDYYFGNVIYDEMYCKL